MKKYVVAMCWGVTAQSKWWGDTPQERFCMSIYQQPAESAEVAEAIAVCASREHRHKEFPNEHVRLVGMYSQEIT